MCSCLQNLLQVDKIMDQIFQYITTYDIIGLRDYWNFLEMRIFSSVDTTLSEDVPKLHKGLLRYYVTYAHQQGKNEKVVEFFDKMSLDLSNNVDWKEWFSKQVNDVFMLFLLLHYFSWLGSLQPKQNL